MRLCGVQGAPCAAIRSGRKNCVSGRRINVHKNAVVSQSRFSAFVRRPITSFKAAEVEADIDNDSVTSKAEETLKSDGAGQKSTLQRLREALMKTGKDDEIEFFLDDIEADLLRLSEESRDAEKRAESSSAAAATARDQLVRLTADFDNFRRRTADEKLSQADNIRGDLLLQLLPLVDNFELARTQVKPETEGEIKINNSYQGLYKQMVDIMRQVGVEAVQTEGQPFDPTLHEAIMQEPNSDVPDNTVLMEFRKGFRINGKLLRPAMVKVSVNEGAGVASSEE